ncbi:MAG: polysaccharide deacetylase family protein [Pseudonocardia sp.]|nr:polysaccharide deacetylase family protein [Pseudonocardia sp.]
MDPRPRRMPRRALLRLGLALAGLGAAAGCAATAPAAPGTRPAGDPTAGTVRPGPGTEVTRADSGRPEVALTFHGAGDLGLARRILATLHDRGAAVTVLAVGTWLAQYPDAAKLVTGLGHELGNHTWSHVDIDDLDEAGARAEIERCRDGIAAATGGPARSPGPRRPSTPPPRCAGSRRRRLPR